MLPLLLHLLGSDTTGYWQQQVAYQITASLDEPSGVLTGHVRMTYVNRSPDTLSEFFVHQYLNAFRPGSHTLRHSAVQRLVDANFDLKTIGDFVGHRSARSTEHRRSFDLRLRRPDQVIHRDGGV